MDPFRDTFHVCVRIRPNPFKTTPLKNTWVCRSVPIINWSRQKKTKTHSWSFFFRSKIPCFVSCLCFGGRNLEIFGLHHYLRGPHEEAKGFPRRGRGKASKILKMFFGSSEAWSWYGVPQVAGFLFTDAHSKALCQFRWLCVIGSWSILFEMVKIHQKRRNLFNGQAFPARLLVPIKLERNRYYTQPT